MNTTEEHTNSDPFNPHGPKQPIITEPAPRPQSQIELTGPVEDRVPDARLVFAVPQLGDSEKVSKGAGAIAHICPMDTGWDVVSVLQRTCDVRFTLDFPVDDFLFRCAIYYDAASDACVFRNFSEIEVVLVDSSNVTKLVPQGQYMPVDPGMWCITKPNGAVEPPHLLEILILRRKFSVQIEAKERIVTHLGKRKAYSHNDDASATKRLKHSDADNNDVTEVMLAPHASGNRRVLVERSGPPLVNLQDGDVAVIRSTAHETDTQMSYRLEHTGKIALTTSASVFSARHEAMSDQIIAKVMKYERSGNEATNIVTKAQNWEREVKWLQKLKHPNIVELKGFDSRMFAIYLEVLPRSLLRGSPCTLTKQDGDRILRDIASALNYLAQCGVVHNDIKPGNIAYSLQRGAVLLDFGLAASASSGASTGGTPWYVPPEYMEVETRGTAGDIYAMGVTMLYVLRKISLPESQNGWLIANLKISVYDKEKARAWNDMVAKIRDALDSTDLIERLIRNMVASTAEERISARELLDALHDETVEGKGKGKHA